MSDHKRYGELKFPFECQQENDCRALFSTLCDITETSALKRERFVTADEINDEMGKLFNLLVVEKKNKPGDIAYSPSKGDNFNKMSVAFFYSGLG